MSRQNFAAALLAALTLLSACGKNDPQKDAQAGPLVAPAPVTKPKEAIPLAALPRTVTPQHYALTVTIDPKKDRFIGHAEIEVVFHTEAKAIFIDGNQIDMKNAAAILPDGRKIPAGYAQVDPSGVAYMNFAAKIPAGKAKLVFDYDAPFNHALAGLYKVKTKAGDDYAFTQFENIDARRMFPGFDEPGFKTPFDVTVIAPVDDKVIANTPVVTDSGVGNGMMKWVFAQTKPLPTYLLALAVGPLDIVDGGDIPANQYRDHPVHLRGITAKGMGSKIKYALSLTPSVVAHLEAYYGVGYPWQKLDILAVPDFAAGAMENAGAVTFREELLLMDGDAPLQQRRDGLSVQAHELAHQWFGDLVTPKWWDDIWLNESFATWMSSKISAQVKPDEEFGRARLASTQDVMRLDELPSARQIHQPVNNVDDIDNAFDDITYSKGGGVLTMFENYVGPEAWQKGIHAYLTKYAYGNATAHDFISTIATATNHPEIVKAFDSFINQPGIPLLRTQLTCGTASTVGVAQSPYTSIGLTPVPHQWGVPMCLTADGAKTCQMVAAPSVQVSLAKCPAVLFPNAEGAGYYRFALDSAAEDKLFAAAPTLDPADQYTLFRNADAAMRGGYGSATAYFGLIHALAPVAQWDLVQAIDNSLRDLRVTGIVPALDIPKVQAFVRANFSARLAALGLAGKYGESPGDALLRQYLTQLLVEEGRDPATLNPLIKAANIYLTSGERNTGGISPDLRTEAMRAAVIAGGPQFTDALLASMQRSDDEYFIQSVIYAVSGAPDDASLRKLLDLTLTPAIRIGDIRYVFRYMQDTATGRPVAWAWFKTNFDAFLKRVSRDGMESMPNIQENGCDAAAKADLDAFFGPRTADLPGTPRVLQENDDRIERCIAFKQAKGGEVTAAVAKLK
ncbi:MAG TPA: M1 family metallopeptidase [Rhizomicrobium sp.]|nr:M1 family metallopeptidase [Rhizomicrobium sp.]